MVRHRTKTESNRIVSSNQVSAPRRDSHHPQSDRPLVDKFGNRYTAAILRNWSAAALEVMRIHRVDDEGWPARISPSCPIKKTNRRT